MVVTFEGDNLKEEEIVERESGGRIVKLNLPERLVLIANHQVCVAHFPLQEPLCFMTPADICRLVVSMVSDLQIWHTQRRINHA